MKNSDLTENNFQTSDHIESYFKCISSCDIKDGNCISSCVEILKNWENWIFYFFCKLVMLVGLTFNSINLFFRFNNILIFLLILFSFIWLMTSEDVSIFLLPTFMIMSFYNPTFIRWTIKHATNYYLIIICFRINFFY